MNEPANEQSDSVEAVVTRQPMQQLVEDSHGVTRFRENSIVRHLLDQGGLDMNHLASLRFSNDDCEQFAQLIGYSLSGFGDLSYVRDDTYDVASKMQKDGLGELEARIRTLEQKLRDVRKCVRSLATSLFRIHREDLAE